MRSLWRHICWLCRETPIVGVFWLGVLLATVGCTELLPLAGKSVLSSLGGGQPAPLIGVKQQTGDNGVKGVQNDVKADGPVHTIKGGDAAYKGAGHDFKTEGNVGKQVGGDDTTITGAGRVEVTNVKTSQLFWYTLIVIAGVIGWMIKTTPQDLINRWTRKKK